MKRVDLKDIVLEVDDFAFSMIIERLKNKNGLGSVIIDNNGLTARSIMTDEEKYGLLNHLEMVIESMTHCMTDGNAEMEEKWNTTIGRRLALSNLSYFTKKGEYKKANSILAGYIESIKKFNDEMIKQEEKITKGKQI